MALSLGKYIATGLVSGGEVARQIVPSQGELIGASGQTDIRLAEATGAVSGELAEKYKAEEEAKIKADNAAFVMDRVTAFEDETRTQQNTYLERLGKNADGIDREATGFASEATERALDGVTDERVRVAIIDQLSSRRRSFLNTIDNHSRTQRLASFRNTQVARQTGLQQDFLSTGTPEEEAEVIRNLSLTTQSLGLAQGRSPEEIEIDLAGQVSKVTSSKAVTIAGTDPQAALNYYNEHEASILPLDRAGLRDRIQGKIDEQQRKVEKARKDKRAELVGGLDDAYTYMIETGDAANMQNISTSLRAMGFDDDASDVELQVRAGSMAYNIVSQDQSEAFTARLQNAQAAFPVHGVENAADIVKARDMATQAIAKQAKAFQADPAGYVDASIPGAINGPSRIRARLERQRELGDGLNYSPTALTLNEKKAFANKWNELESARDKLDFAVSLEAEYGDFTPQVYKEAGFPVGAMAAADLVKTNFTSEADAELLLAASTLKPDEIPTRPDLSRATVQSAVQDSQVFGVYTHLAALAGADVTLQRTVQGLQAALSNAVLLSGDPDKASMLDNFYGVINDDEYVLTYDKQRVQDNKLEDALAARKQSARASVVGVTDPNNLVSRLFGSSYDNATAWINAPDGNGWVLFNKGSQTIVSDQQGNTVRVTVDDVNAYVPRGDPFDYTGEASFIGGTGEPTGFGNRADGTEKGNGFFGTLTRSDGGISTELSVGVEFDGVETEIPLLVPTLTSSEIDSLLEGDEPTDAIMRKAVKHAQDRIADGKSPFAQAGEQQRRPR